MGATEILLKQGKRNEVKSEKHLEPICQGCRAYDSGFCLNLHESIETDVIICQHFMGWNAE
jgi:hypothetical protein